MKYYSFKRKLGILSLTAALSFIGNSGCGPAATSSTTTSTSSTNFTAPLLAPIVNSALPAGLQSSTTTTAATKFDQIRPIQSFRSIRHQSTEQKHNLNSQVHIRTGGTSITPTNGPTPAIASMAGDMVKAMFTEYYASANGGFNQGYLNNLILTFDSRLSGLNTQISGNSTPPTCLSTSPGSTAIDLSGIDSMLNFTSPYMQCLGAFGASDTQGVAFGSSGTNYSVWLQLGSDTAGVSYDQSGGFFGAANVINYGSKSATSPETVDGFLLSATGTQSQYDKKITVARFTASPVINSFAFFVGSNVILTSGDTDITGASGAHDSYLGAGFRVASDGNFIYSDGYMLNQSGDNEYYFYNVCLKSSDLTVDPTPSDCTTLANGYVSSTWASIYSGLPANPNPLSTSASLTFNEVTGCNSTLPQWNNTSGVASTIPVSNGCSTGQGAPGNGPETYPDAAIYTVLKPVELPPSLLSMSSN